MVSIRETCRQCYTLPMPDFIQSIHEHKDLPVADQKKAGQPAGDDMDAEHKNFLKKVIGMLDRNEIDVTNPESFLNKDIYATLPPDWKAKTDTAMVNIADQLRRIEAFYRNKDIPDASPELQTMIEHLWLMKQRIEEKYDVFVF